MKSSAVRRIGCGTATIAEGNATEFQNTPLVNTEVAIATDTSAAPQTAAPRDRVTSDLRVIQDSFRAVSRAVLPVVAEINVVDIVERPAQSVSPFDFFFGSRGMGTTPPSQESQVPSVVEPIRPRE